MVRRLALLLVAAGLASCGSAHRALPVDGPAPEHGTAPVSSGLAAFCRANPGACPAGDDVASHGAAPAPSRAHAISFTPGAIAPCDSRMSVITIGPVRPARPGTRGVLLRVTNRAHHACYLKGFPRADVSGTRARPNAATPQTIVFNRNDHAVVRVTQDRCDTAARASTLRVQLPGVPYVKQVDIGHLTEPTTRLSACGGGLRVGPVQAP